MPRCLTRRVLGYANLGRPSLNKRKQRYGRDKYRCCHAFGLLASSVCSTGKNKSAQNGQRFWPWKNPTAFRQGNGRSDCSRVICTSSHDPCYPVAVAVTRRGWHAPDLARKLLRNVASVLCEWCDCREECIQKRQNLIVMVCGVVVAKRDTWGRDSRKSHQRAGPCFLYRHTLTARTDLLTD